MANTFDTTQYVLNDVFIRYWNNLGLVRTASRNLEDDFKNATYATGQTLNYRKEERYLGGEGASATAENRVQITAPLSITKQFHTLLEYTGFELTFDRARDEPYLDMANGPRAKRLANQTESFVAQELQKKTYQAVGTPGVAIDFDTMLSADTYMTELAIPEDGKRYGALNPRNSQSLSADLYTVFNNTVNKGALMDGFIGHLTGYDLFKSNFFTRQIAGDGEAGGAPPAGFKLGGIVTGGPVSSGSSLSVSGVVAASVVYKEGDIIEVDDASGVYMVNALTYDSIQNQRAQFVVTADVTSTAGGLATIPISPEIVISGARQNISAAIPNGAQLLLRDDHNVSIAYHSQAVVFAAPRLKELRGGVEAKTAYSDLYKLAMTYSLGADVRNYEQLDRIDLICGVAINPEYAVRICS